MRSTSDAAVAGLWRYRLLGEEFGPVPLATLQELLASGDLGPADEIAGGDGRWRRADAVPELTGRLADDELEVDDDLASLLEQVDSAAADATQSPRVADGWYARILGADLGPFEWDRLSFMAAQGELSREDEIRRGTNGLWQPAGEIVGLFDALLTDAASPPDAQARWFLESAGDESPGCTWSELQALVAAGRLSPRDRLREGTNPMWLRAATLPGLFTEQERSRTWAGQAEQPLAISSRNSPTAIETVVASAASSPPEPAAPAAVDPPDKWAQFFDAAEEREQKRRRRDQKPAPVPTPPAVTASAPAAETRAALQTPAAATPAPSTFNRPLTPPPPPAKAPPAFVPPPKPRRTRQGPLFDFSGLRDKFQGGGAGGPGAKLLVPLVLGLVLVGWRFLPSFGAQPGAKDYPVLESLWQQALQIQERKGAASDWAALEAQARPVLDDLLSRLAPVVKAKGKEAPIAQRILWMVDDGTGPTGAPGYFRKILSAAGNVSETDFFNASEVMSEAASFLPRT